MWSGLKQKGIQTDREELYSKHSYKRRKRIKTKNYKYEHGTPKHGRVLLLNF